jgi:hypothetical protein
MCELKKEMKLFLEECGLPNDLIRLEEWNSLQEILPSILADQPIIKPCDGIALLKSLVTAWLRLTPEGIGQHFEGGFRQQLTRLA